MKRLMSLVVSILFGLQSAGWALMSTTTSTTDTMPVTSTSTVDTSSTTTGEVAAYELSETEQTTTGSTTTTEPTSTAYASSWQQPIYGPPPMPSQPILVESPDPKVIGVTVTNPDGSKSTLTKDGSAYTQTIKFPDGSTLIIFYGLDGKAVQAIYQSAKGLVLGEIAWNSDGSVIVYYTYNSITGVGKTYRNGTINGDVIGVSILYDRSGKVIRMVRQVLTARGEVIEVVTDDKGGETIYLPTEDPKGDPPLS